jgi:predicted Zn-dependent protease
MNKVYFLLVITFLLSGCALNQVTGRKQLNLVSESEMQLMAVDQYSTFLSEHKVLNPGSNSSAAMVLRVGSRIANAVTAYYTRQGMQAILEGYAWEFSTIDEKDVVNAWCMPGGKVAVYTGLLPVTQNETALAIVMGHEIAHAVAKHGNERMSQAMVQQLGGRSPASCIGSATPTNARTVFNVVWHWKYRWSHVTLVAAAGNRSGQIWAYICCHGWL